jgi:hypothetical protein
MFNPSRHVLSQHNKEKFGIKPKTQTESISSPAQVQQKYIIPPNPPVNQKVFTQKTNEGFCSSGTCGGYKASESASQSCNGCGSGSYSQFRSFNDTDNPWSYSAMLTCAPGTSFPFPQCACNSSPQAIPACCNNQRIIPTCQGNFNFEIIRPYVTNYTSCGTPCSDRPYVDYDSRGCRACTS